MYIFASFLYARQHNTEIQLEHKFQLHEISGSDREKREFYSVFQKCLVGNYMVLLF